MKVSTKNEYGELKSVMLGRAEGANWPTGDNFFDRMQNLSTYHKKLRRGPIPEHVIQEAREDLFRVRNILRDHGVTVFRPEIVDHRKQTMHYQYMENFTYLTTGMHSYSARDLILTVGNMAIECPTPFVSRYQEFQAYDVVKQEAIRDGCKWIAAPRARMESAECMIKGSPAKINLTERYPIFDAANVLKFDDKLLYMTSSTANRIGAKWLQNVVGTEFEVIVWDDVYAHAHIDSTLISLNKDTIMINASRVDHKDKLPRFLRDHNKIWIEDVAERDFYLYPYASKWIGMNVLTINPETVMIDPIQTDLKKQLGTKMEVLTAPLRHSRTLGGGHHCVTCDLERS